MQPMSIRRLLLYLTIASFLACFKQKHSAQPDPTSLMNPSTATKEKMPNEFILAFGSCNDQKKPQHIWNEIIQEQADLWVWLGDNIYADTEDMNFLQSAYAKQNKHPEYAAFKKSTPINGTWDDHDYGLNDGGKEYAQKAASQQLFLDFIGVPKDDLRRQHAGVYGSQDVVSDQLHIKIIYLDTRYFRDALHGKRGAYSANHEGTILGAEQWAWLAKEITNSRADVHIFASSIQIIPEEHGWEKWANFPSERNRFLDLLASNTALPIIISGDRHAAEISALEWKGKMIYDITSSGLTNVTKPRAEANQHRIAGSNLVFDKNYGILKINRQQDEIAVLAEIKTAFDQTSLSHTILVPSN